MRTARGWREGLADRGGVQKGAGRLLSSLPPHVKGLVQSEQWERGSQQLASRNGRHLPDTTAQGSFLPRTQLSLPSHPLSSEALIPIPAPSRPSLTLLLSTSPVQHCSPGPCGLFHPCLLVHCLPSSLFSHHGSIISSPSQRLLDTAPPGLPYQISHQALSRG